MSPHDERELAIEDEGDVVAARQMVRQAAQAVGFGVTDTTRIVTAASELTRNICNHAGAGVMRVRSIDEDGRSAIELEFVDQGPGIPDVAQAMEEGYSTSGGLGLGLPGSKRLMDEMEVESAVGRGTTVRVRKWLKA
jgi:serine/threonine-protein kinase RsbT